MNFVNLTPHDINVVGLGLIPASGMVARVTTVREEVCGLGVRLVRQRFGAVEGMPSREPNTIYVVSAMVLSALRESETDTACVVAPDTGADALRENGHIVAVRGFVCN